MRKSAPARSAAPAKKSAPAARDSATIKSTGETKAQAAQSSSMVSGLRQNFLPNAEKVGRGVESAAETAGTVGELSKNSAAKLTRGAKVLGPAATAVSRAAGLPQNFSDAGNSISQAVKTGNAGDIARASSDTTNAASQTAQLARGALEVPQNLVTGQGRKAAAEAFKEVAPNASRGVSDTVAKTAGQTALDGAKDKTARRAVTHAASEAAKSGGTLASGAGATSRAAAKELLQEGGEAAAKAAAQTVGKSALKGAAKAAGRFVPGLNVAIAGLDSATAAASWADPKASLGKKLSNSVTAAGSIAAATNIPIVSQVGATISTISSFVGAFF